MFQSSLFAIRSLSGRISCRNTHRYKDYKTLWRKEGILDDWQNLGYKQKTLTEQWEKERTSVCDISRLPSFLRQRMSDKMRVAPPRERYERTVDYERSTFGLFGRASGFNPGRVCWAPVEWVEAQKDREQNYEARFEGLMESAREKRQARESAIEEFQNRIRRNLEALPGAIAHFHQKKTKVKEDAIKKRKNQMNLKREAREHFGFDIDMRDPRMQKFREMKAEEAKKKSKESKKKLKIIQ